MIHDDLLSLAQQMKTMGDEAKGGQRFMFYGIESRLMDIYHTFRDNFLTTKKGVLTDRMMLEQLLDKFDILYGEGDACISISCNNTNEKMELVGLNHITFYFNVEGNFSRLLAEE